MRQFPPYKRFGYNVRRESAFMSQQFFKKSAIIDSRTVDCQEKVKSKCLYILILPAQGRQAYYSRIVNNSHTLETNFVGYAKTADAAVLSFRA